MSRDNVSDKTLGVICGAIAWGVSRDFENRFGFLPAFPKYIPKVVKCPMKDYYGSAAMLREGMPK